MLHTPGVPQIVDSNDVTFTSGNQELFLTTLPTTSSHSYSIVDEGDQTATTDIYRLQDNFTTGSATNILLHAITIGSAGSSDAVSVAISGETATTWTITFSSATGGTATLVLNSGIFSLGGSFGYAASGTPVLSPLSNAIETIAVTSGGPVWGSSGSSEAALAMGVLSVAADSASSNDGTTSSQTTTTNSSSTLFRQGNETPAAVDVSLSTRKSLTVNRTRVNDKAHTAILPESLLDSLSQDLILSKHKKAGGR